jgi:hypothetical protein
MMPIIFDQYSRYRACAEILKIIRFNSKNTLLDVGSGPECLLGEFLKSDTITYLDPLILPENDKNKIAADIFEIVNNKLKFDFISAVDVFEHVPENKRIKFLEAICNSVTHGLVLAFPSSDSLIASDVDLSIDKLHRSIFGKDYHWLQEHYSFGLPSSSETILFLEGKGFYCQSIGHGHGPWLKELLGAIICAGEIPNLKKTILDISKKFNKELYQYDFSGPHYRNFIIATREPQKKIILGSKASKASIDVKYNEVLKYARSKLFSDSLSTLYKYDLDISRLNKGVNEVSNWNQDLQSNIIERDEQLIRLNEQIQEVSTWAKSLQSSIVERDAAITHRDNELVKRDEQLIRLNEQIQEVSTWAKSLQSSIVERDAAITHRDNELVKRDEQLIRLNEQIQEVSTWAKSLQSSIVERENDILVLKEGIELANSKIINFEVDASKKQAELMKLSDWAYSMMQELTHLKRPISIKIRDGVNSFNAVIKNYFLQTPIGKMAQFYRDKKVFKGRAVAFENIKASLDQSDGQLLLVFPIITWDFRWQRPQHIVSRLRDRGYSVLYMAMTLSPIGGLFRNRMHAGSVLKVNQLENNINQIWLNSVNPLNVYTDQIDGVDLKNFVDQLKILIDELRPKSITYLLQFPGWWPIARELRYKVGGKVVFDCMDDHSGFSTNTALALNTEHELIIDADLVISSSDLLENKCLELNKNTIQVKNGTDYKHFFNCVRNSKLDHLAGSPLAGYFGAISDWFDIDIVVHCAKNLPNWNFVLIGSTFGADLKDAESISNIHFLGEIPYQELPGYLAYFDVCMIPFRLIPLTLATNPVKFYEYISAGKPVVSINLPELERYREYCYIAESKEEFLERLKDAFSDRNLRDKFDARLRLAQENSWEIRANDIYAAMRSGM